MSLAEHWQQLVPVALLGTDRRDPPPPPAGPVAELGAELGAELVAGTDVHDPASVLVRRVATITVLRRCASRPAPTPALLAVAPDDPRPICPPVAAAHLHRVLQEWPDLETEWIATATRLGWRLSPDLVPLLLARHRSDPDHYARVMALAGPLADWLVGHLPALGPHGRRARTPVVVPLPEPLARLVEASPAEVVAVVADGLRRQEYTTPSRGVLVALLGAVPPAGLAEIRDRLEGLDPSMPGIGLAYHLAHLADLRHGVHHLLAPPPISTPTSIPRESP